MSSVIIFTFHYVSIKSIWHVNSFHERYDLHSTMYLLNLEWSKKVPQNTVHLHSTMYLLNPRSTSYQFSILLQFTFHYVSIKSAYQHCESFREIDLHSTMYLLNLAQQNTDYAQTSNLHSTMYLLNLPCRVGLSSAWCKIYIPLCIY